MSESSDSAKDDLLPIRRSRREITLTRKAREAEEDDLYHPPSTSSARQTPTIAEPRTMTRHTPGPKPRRKSSKSTDRPSDAFSPARFLIYAWPTLPPADLTNPCPRDRAWERKADVAEKAADIDDGSDDWYAFGKERDRAVVARTFVNRAKRAFWAGETWDTFAYDERRAYSETVAKSQSAFVLSGRLRWEVWEAVKERLCEEIWSQPYVDPPGLVKLPVVGTPQARGEKKKDSLLPDGEPKDWGVRRKNGKKKDWQDRLLLSPTDLDFETSDEEGSWVANYLLN